MFFQLKVESRLVEENLRTEVVLLQTASMKDREILQTTSMKDREMIDKLQSDSAHDKEVIEGLKSELDIFRVSYVTLQIECCALRKNEQFSKFVLSLDKKSE